MEKDLCQGLLLPGTSNQDELALSQSEHKDKSSSAQLGAGVGSQRLEIAISEVLASTSTDQMTPMQDGSVQEHLSAYTTLEKPSADLVCLAKKGFIERRVFLYLCIAASCNSARRDL